MDKPGGGKAVKWIIGAAFIGWAGIIRMAYNMADARANLCTNGYPSYSNECAVRALAVRDGILTTGLIVALVAAIIIALTFATELSRLNWRQAPKWRHKKWGDTQPIHLPDQRDV